MSRIEGIDKVVVYGIQAFCVQLEKDCKEFFDTDWETLKTDLTGLLTKGLSYPQRLIDLTVSKFKELHDLGYLPVQITSLREGSLCKIGEPMIEIKSTADTFHWVAQYIESVMSCNVWYPIVTATFSREYAKIAKYAYGKTCNADYMNGLSDFSMRGMSSWDSSLMGSSAFLTCFNNSSTVGAADYIQNICKYEGEPIIKGLTSTEHSVMCSDVALNGKENEIETYRRLLTEVYPDVSFCAVCDSYDFWNVVENILPKLKNEIENHNGFIGIRHDSDEPIHALCGITSEEKENISLEDKGMVQVLYELFGGTKNDKGYIELNPKIKAVYGDSITIPRAKEIYKRLEEKGFAANCVSLGVGSFSMHCVEQNGDLKPFTRDTFSIAIKATAGEYIDNNGIKQEIDIFKSPKGNTEKVSLKGKDLLPKDNVYVYFEADNGNKTFHDNFETGVRTRIKESLGE
jgi:nicotinamide phosphoribosyltransferase